jgi:hypothetical protein
LLDKQCKLWRPHHPTQGPPAHTKWPRSWFSECTTFLRPAMRISHPQASSTADLREEFSGDVNDLAATDLAFLLDSINDSARSLVPHRTYCLLPLGPAPLSFFGCRPALSLKRAVSNARLERQLGVNLRRSRTPPRGASNSAAESRARYARGARWFSASFEKHFPGNPGMPWTTMRLIYARQSRRDAAAGFRRSRAPPFWGRPRDGARIVLAALGLDLTT